LRNKKGVLRARDRDVHRECQRKEKGRSGARRRKGESKKLRRQRVSTLATQPTKGLRGKDWITVKKDWSDRIRD